MSNSRSADIQLPLVPVSYAARLVNLLEARGVEVEAALAGTGFVREQLQDPVARMTLAAFSQLANNAVALTGDLSIGFEVGLSLKASSHGMLGFALITCNSVRDAILLSERYVELRSSPWRVRLIVEGGHAILRFHEVVPIPNPARTLMLEGLLGATISLGEFMQGVSFHDPAIEFSSDSPELPHHARYRDRVPRVRYNAPFNEARFPASWLDRPLALHEPVANREVVTALENERRLLAPGDDLLERTRALLSNPANGFPDLEQAAGRLSVSSRTLRRHLSQRGTTFQALRDEVRRAHSITLLEQSQLTVDEVSRELGYADAAGFIRAFQRWTGETPSNYRQRVRGLQSPP